MKTLFLAVVLGLSCVSLADAQYFIPYQAYGVPGVMEMQWRQQQIRQWRQQMWMQQRAPVQSQEERDRFAGAMQMQMEMGNIASRNYSMRPGPAAAPIMMFSDGMGGYQWSDQQGNSHLMERTPAGDVRFSP